MVGEMGLKGTSSVKAQRDSYGITTILTAAVCEWFLILMLLINSILSYLATKFARYCDLQLPCILCSGFHHVLGNKKKRGQFYLDVLCNHHRSELSHLISCQIHGNLADGRDMCDDCLLSFISKNKSNVDMQRVILGKLGLEGCELQTKNDFMNLPPAGVSCSCCEKPWISKTNVQKSFQLPPSANQAAKPNILVPRRLGRRESLKRFRDKISGSTTPRHSPKIGEISGPTTTPRQSAKEEILGSTIPRHPGKSGYESMSHVGYTQLKLNSDSESEFPFSDDDDDPGNVVKTSLETPQQEAIKPRNLKPVPSEVNIHERAESELNRQEKEKNDSTLALPELISLDDIPSPSNVEETPVEVSPQNANYSRLSELISLVNTPSKSDLREEAPNSASSAISGSDFRNVQITKHEEILDSLGPAAEAVTKINQVVSDQTPVDHELSLDEIDASAQGNQLSVSNTSPDEQNHDDDLQTTGRFSVDAITSINTEFGDKAIVDKLKQQIEHDQICMNELYKELEEERNAAMIAANEAMAMITRLQEEKAALHMDALQYLRMMEEQAEYDVDALEKANDLLAEKEKEIQDLETELDYYRLRYPEESDMVPGVNFDFKEKSVVTEVTLPSLHDSSEKTVKEISEGNDHKPEVLSVWSELEDEKLYISKHLKHLEKKIRKFTREGASPDISDSEDSENGDENGQICSLEKENGSSLDKAVPNGIHPLSEKSNGLREDQSSIDNHENSNHGGEGEIVALENEISDHERLEALEGDFNFLEHSFNSV